MARAYKFAPELRIVNTLSKLLANMTQYTTFEVTQFECSIEN